MSHERTQLEEIIVSILLKAPEKLLTTQLESRWFIKFRRVIEAIQCLSGEGIAIDAFSLHDKLPSVETFQAMEWQRSAIGSPENYQNYVNKLRETFVADGLKESLAHALQSIADGEKPVAALAALMSSAGELQNADGRNFNYDAKSGQRKFIENLDEVYDSRDTGGTGLKLGLPALDGVLGGLHPSDMVVVGARPGVGKTAFALSAILRLCRQGKRVGFFSTEMPVIQVMGRLTAMVANISAKKLRDADLDELEWARLTSATKEIQGFKLMVCDKPNITAGEITMQSRAWAMADGLDFIAVDYLTRIKPDKPTGNQNLDVGEVTMSMKNIARVLDVPLMLLAQLNRGPATRTDKKPRASDLRDSGIIEQEADAILLLYRACMDDATAPANAAEIIVDKNRHGELATVECQYIPHLTRWDAYQESRS